MHTLTLCHQIFPIILCFFYASQLYLFYILISITKWNRGHRACTQLIPVIHTVHPLLSICLYAPPYLSLLNLYLDPNLISYCFIDQNFELDELRYYANYLFYVLQYFMCPVPTVPICTFHYDTIYPYFTLLLNLFPFRYILIYFFNFTYAP